MARDLTTLPRPHRDDRWLTTEAGWRIFTRTHHPRGGTTRRPAVLVVPGYGAPGTSVQGWGQVVNTREIAALGCAVMTVDLSGRGRSWGIEAHGGPAHHGDVRTALRHLARRDEVDPDRIGVVTLSMGVVAVAGALAEGDRPPVAWWIDWEGPSDRETITAGGTRMAPAMGHSLEDEAYWRSREPVRSVGLTGVPYLRYQAARDHAQPGELRHAVRMLRAAADGDLPWFQLNDHPVGEIPATPRWMPPGIEPARRWILDRISALHGCRRPRPAPAR